MPRNSRGRVRWKTDPLDYGLKGPAIRDDTVYVDGFGDLIALKTSGREVWTIEMPGHVSPPALDGELVYVNTGGEIVAVDAETAMVRWQFRTQWRYGDPERGLFQIPHDPPVAVAEGVVYAPGEWGMLALDALTGGKQWYLEHVGPVLSAPAVVNRMLYFGTSGNLFAVDAATGQVRWQFRLGNTDRSSPAVSDGIVYIACKDGCLYAVGGSA